MKRPTANTPALVAKLAEGNLMYWADHLHQDYNQFFLDNRELLNEDHKLLAIRTLGSIRRLIDDDLVQNIAFGAPSTRDRADMALVRIAVDTLNSDTVEAAIAVIDGAPGELVNYDRPSSIQPL